MRHYNWNKCKKRRVREGTFTAPYAVFFIHVCPQSGSLESEIFHLLWQERRGAHCFSHIAARQGITPHLRRRYFLFVIGAFSYRVLILAAAWISLIGKINSESDNQR